MRPSTQCTNTPAAGRQRLAERKNRGDRTPLSIILVNGSGADPLGVLNSFFIDKGKDRNRYEIVWVDFFEPVASQIMEKADTVIVCDKREIYNSHGAYNAGILRSSGQVITLWDTREHLPAGFADRVCKGFNLTGSGFPDEVVMRHTPGSSVSFRKVDAIRFGGFDESELFYGISRDPLDLHRRLLNAGIPAKDDPSHATHASTSHEQSPSPAISKVVEREHVDRRYRGRIFPLKENPEIKGLRTSMRPVGLLFDNDLSTELGMSGMPAKYRAKLGRRPTAVGLHANAFRTRLLNFYARSRSVALENLKRILGSRRYEAVKRIYCAIRGQLRGQ